MYETKTKENKAGLKEFLDRIEDKQKKKDAKDLMELMQDITGLKPAMWGPSIIGFGSYHYTYDSGHEGDMCLTGFSPRKQALTLYLSSGFPNYEPLLKKLGKHKTSKGCLYIKKLEDVDLAVLEQLIRESYVYFYKYAKDKKWIK